MKPYYEDDACTIYHGDCRDVLPTVSGDVLVTDPPYGVGLIARRARNKGGGSHYVGTSSTLYDDDPEEIEALIQTAIPMALSVTTRGIVFPGTRMLHAYPRPVAVGVVWLPAGSGYTPWGFQTSTPILYYGADPYLADGKGNRPNGFHGRGNREKFDHPCPKPLEWLTWAIERASRPGETVIDPFLGSGTTAVAAKKHGRKSIGIEIEERYCEIAATRLAQEVLDLGA